MITERHKPRYPSWSHEDIIEYQREKIRNVIGGSSQRTDTDLNLNEPPNLETVDEIQGYVRRWEEEEEPDKGGSEKPTVNELGEYDRELADKLEAYEARLNIRPSAGGDGSAVKLDSTANQNAQETLHFISQPKRHYVGEELEIEWEIDRFVWWSEFLKRLPRVYLKLLELLGIEEGDYCANYRGFYNYKHVKQNPDCPVGSIYVPVVDCGRYHPYASVKHRRRASVRALDRLEFLEEECKKRRVKFDYLVTIDLTLPKVVSELWADSDVQDRIRRAIQDFLADLHEELFPGHHSQFGVIKNPHFWATENPLEPHRHIHLTLPNVTYNKNTDMFHRFRPHIDKDLIKRVWKECLVKNDLWLGVLEDADPDIWTEYFRFDNREKVLHRLSYCARKPVEDLVRELSLDDLADFDENFALFLLDYTPRRVNLGFLTNLKRFGYSRKPAPFCCPICGCEMEPELNKVGDKRLYPRPPPEILHLFRDRKGNWRETINLVTRW